MKMTHSNFLKYLKDITNSTIQKSPNQMGHWVVCDQDNTLKENLSKSTFRHNASSGHVHCHFD